MSQIIQDPSHRRQRGTRHISSAYCDLTRTLWLDRSCDPRNCLLLESVRCCSADTIRYFHLEQTDRDCLIGESPRIKFSRIVIPHRRDVCSSPAGLHSRTGSRIYHADLTFLPDSSIFGVYCIYSIRTVLRPDSRSTVCLAISKELPKYFISLHFNFCCYHLLFTSRSLVLLCHAII